MTVSASFTPLYGADGSSVCCLLKIGGVHILLDCGWDERFHKQLLEPVLRWVWLGAKNWVCAAVCLTEQLGNGAILLRKRWVTSDCVDCQRSQK